MKSEALQDGDAMLLFLSSALSLHMRSAKAYWQAQTVVIVIIIVVVVVVVPFI